MVHSTKETKWIRWSSLLLDLARGRIHVDPLIDSSCWSNKIVICMFLSNSAAVGATRTTFASLHVPHCSETHDIYVAC